MSPRGPEFRGLILLLLPQTALHVDALIEIHRSLISAKYMAKQRSQSICVKYSHIWVKSPANQGFFRLISVWARCQIAIWATMSNCPFESWFFLAKSPLNLTTNQLRSQSSHLSQVFHCRRFFLDLNGRSPRRPLTSYIFPGRPWAAINMKAI